MHAASYDHLTVGAHPDDVADHPGVCLPVPFG